MLETATTVATSFAPTKALTGGNLEWQVTALDGAGQRLGASPWRAYTVKAGPTATTKVAISGSGRVGQALSIVAPDWDMPDVATSYVWLRNGSVINGATDTTYTPTADDLTRKITVRASGVRAGYGDGTSTSDPVTVVDGEQLSPTVAPSVTGQATVGSTLTANPGSWPSATTPSFSYQWLRNGVELSSARLSTYRVAATDAGARLSVRVTASPKGYKPTVITTNSVAVAKLASTVSVRVKPNPVRRTRQATVSGAVAVPGVSYPTGRVQVLLRTRVVKTITLTTTARGAYSVLLPRRSVGKYVVTVKYLGSAVANPSKRAVTLKVVR